MTRAPARCRALSDEEVALYARPFLPVEPREQLRKSRSSLQRHAAACGGAEPRLNSETTPHSGGVSARGGLPHGARDVTVETDVGMGRGGPSPSLPHFDLAVCSCGHRHFLVSGGGGRERAAGQMSASGTCVRACVCCHCSLHRV